MELTDFDAPTMPGTILGALYYQSTTKPTETSVK